MVEKVKTVSVKMDRTAQSPGQRDYDILIGPGLLQDAETIISQKLGGRRLITLYDAGARDYVPEFLKANAFELAEGESTKTFSALEKTLDWILDQKPDRKTIIVAVGGGVTGDHAGFAAAITMRGLDYIQIPTTLLAQVDSSVGGKTGINTHHGKNLVGAFHQPRLVLADTNVLATLPERQMRAGYAEIVKYAFLQDPSFFSWLETQGDKVLARDGLVLAHAIAVSCKAKADIVGADEKESGRRALLNFGHTFGHALEAACGFDRRLLHGEAVAVGMALAFDVSRRMGQVTARDSELASNHMKRMGLPVKIADIKDFPATTPDTLVALMAGDKKAVGGKLTFILAKGIGQAYVASDVDLNIVKDALSSSLKGE